MLVFTVPLLRRGRAERLDRKERGRPAPLVLPRRRRPRHHVLQDAGLARRMSAKVHRHGQGKVGIAVQDHRGHCRRRGEGDNDNYALNNRRER